MLNILQFEVAICDFKFIPTAITQISSSFRQMFGSKYKLVPVYSNLIWTDTEYPFK